MKVFLWLLAGALGVAGILMIAGVPAGSGPDAVPAVGAGARTIDGLLCLAAATGSAIAAGRRKKPSDAADLLGAPPSPETHQLIESSASGSLEAMRTLIAAGADVNGRSNGGFRNLWERPLHVAVRSRDDLGPERVALLLECGADVNGTNHAGRTPLQRLAETRTLEHAGEIASILIHHGAELSVTADRVPPLHSAAAAGSREVVESILDAGESVDSRATLTSSKVPTGTPTETDATRSETRTTRGATPLHFAALDPLVTVEVARALIRRGADPNARTDDGVTPLDIIRHGQARYGIADIESERASEEFAELLTQVADPS